MTPPSTLATVVAMALTEAGLSEDTAAQISGIPGVTLKRRLRTGDFTYGELWKIADALRTTPARLVARAEQATS